MQHNFFEHINIQPDHTFVPDGMEADSEKACLAHEEVIRTLGGVNLQLLGLGNNGHIGFNEPGAAFEKETHLVDLTESTIQANSAFLRSRRMFLHRLTPWESRPLCRRKRFWLW